MYRHSDDELLGATADPAQPHPFHPDRILTEPEPPIDPELPERFSLGLEPLFQPHREYWDQQREKCLREGCQCRFRKGDRCFYEGEYNPRKWLPLEKRAAILGMVNSMAEHYHRPDLALPWALGVAGRELIGSTGIGMGAALMHQYQRIPPSTPVPIHGKLADWWLFLYPGGMDWASLDDQPVNFVLTMVFPTGDDESRMGIEWWCLASHLLKVVTLPEIAQEQVFQKLAELDPHELCMKLNQLTRKCLVPDSDPGQQK